MSCHLENASSAAKISLFLASSAATVDQPLRSPIAQSAMKMESTFPSVSFVVTAAASESSTNTAFAVNVESLTRERWSKLRFATNVGAERNDSICTN